MNTKMTLYFLILLSLLYAQVDYSTEIQPIFNNSCTSCHQYGHNSGLNLTTYSSTMTGGNSGATIVAGDHANSELYNRITLPESAQGDMPPTGSLSQSDIDLISQWIDEGALEIPAVELDTPDVVINEFLAGSETCCGSDIFDGNTEDFVELYNYGIEPININGWGFSDTDGTITTTAPDTSIAPGDFLVLWYTGDNNGFPEINEKLSKDGETIYIADANGNPIISYDFGPQTDDISYGRFPDGSESWTYFSSPTPGTSNIESLQLQNELIPKSFTVFPAYPNPFNPVTTLSYDIPNKGFVDVTVYDMMGRAIKNLVRSDQSYGYKSIKWNATNNQNQIVPAGVYIYKIEFGKLVVTRKMILLK